MKTIKSKITAGLLVLFAVILLLSATSVYFINQLAEQSKSTIIDNYRSIEYVSEMSTALHHLRVHASRRQTDSSVFRHAKEQFEKNLELEAKNITEIGEFEAVRELRQSYQDLLPMLLNISVSHAALDSASASVERGIGTVYRINFNAILAKNNRMQQNTDATTIYISAIVSVFILLSIGFLVAFPESIVSPLNELAKRIEALSEGKYEQPLHISSMQELQQVVNGFNLMSEKVKAFEAKQVDQLLFEKKRMEALVQNLEDGVLLVDENRSVVLVNAIMAAILGSSPSELMGKNSAQLAKSNALLKELLGRASNYNGKNTDSHENKPIQVYVQEKEKYFKFETESILTFSEWLQKEIYIGNLILLKDITTFHQRDKAKTNLLATVSHELKTPLASIKLSLKLLEDGRTGTLNQEQLEAVEALKQQSVRLGRVISEILEYSQIETGNIKLKFSEIPPAELVEIAVTALMVLISEKHIELITDIDEFLAPVHADIEKTVFVLINILNNAIRYTEQYGKIVVTCKKVESSVAISVKDSGPGISEEDIELLFQRFTQVGKGYKRGWGLGLAISKEFMNAQGGKIWVESEVGTGSEFFISFPISV